MLGVGGGEDKGGLCLWGGEGKGAAAAVGGKRSRSPPARMIFIPLERRANSMNESLVPSRCSS